MLALLLRRSLFTSSFQEPIDTLEFSFSELCCFKKTGFHSTLELRGLLDIVMLEREGKKRIATKKGAKEVMMLSCTVICHCLKLKFPTKIIRNLNINKLQNSS
jgi:hypothetical protein